MRSQKHSISVFIGSFWIRGAATRDVNTIRHMKAFRVIVFFLPIFFSSVLTASAQEGTCPNPVTPGQWTSTKIQVTKGENVYIQATGAFQYKDGERRSFGPVGDMYGVWALQAKIGEGQIELIGAKKTFAAKADGVLEVGAPSRLGRPIGEGIEALDIPNSKYCIPLINVFVSTGMNTLVRIKTTASCEVEDSENVKPMGGVKVTIGDKTVTSNANGDAVIGLQPGEYIVLAAPPPDSDAVQGRVYQAGVLNRPSELAKIEVRRGITEAIEVRMKTCDDTGQPKARAKIAQIGKSMEVRIIRADGTVFRQAARVGQILRDGDYLIVNGTGKLDWLSGGTVEFLHPGGSEVRIGPVIPKGTQGVSITKGILRFWLSDPDACTKSVCFSPKGTIYTVGHDESTGISNLSVEEGSVQVIPLNTQLTGLTALAGQQVEIGPTAVRRIGEKTGGGGTGFGPMQYGQDIADAGDYKALDLPEPRPELCEAECAKDPRCKAYAYVRPGTYDYPRPRCWLKEKTGRFIPHANAVSAVKGGAGSTPVTQSNASGTSGENNTDRYGMDYKTLELPQANPDICRDACAGDPNCKAWTYLRPNIYGPNAYCYLKSGVPPATPNACCVSGVKADSPEPTRDAIPASWSTGAPYRGQNIRVTYNCPPGGSANMGAIWGTDYYTYDSSVCIAAVHMGLISFASGGKVTFEMRQGAASYRGSTRNGVTSRDWGAYDGSYVFVR